MADLRLLAPPRRHLLSVSDLERADVERILETARSLVSSLDREVKKLPTLRGRVVRTVADGREVFARGQVLHSHTRTLEP